MCSKSLFFDPDDPTFGLTRLPLREIASIKPRRTTVGSAEVEYFVVHTRLSVEIPPNAPYVFHKHALDLPQSEFLLSLSYVDTATVLEFVQQLHGLYRLSPIEKPLVLAELIRAREEAIQFESSAITDIRERVLLPNGQAVLAQQVQPLLLCPGRLQLTDARIYFQSFNLVSSDVTSRIDLADIQRIYRRRYGMRDTALEIFLPVKQSFGARSSTLAQTSVYFNFKTKSLRDDVFHLITSQDRYAPLKDQSLASMTKSWVDGHTSNFEYLLFLNQQSGRSWVDLTQYPVMPWVLRDFTSTTLDLNDPAVFRDLSKPIGALNQERLETFQRRMRDMPPEISHGHPFLYGSHYSSPGYVLFYLARKAPQYMLRLQAGKFDQPDRLFHSIESTWSSVLNSPTDVKELIPEFYAAPDDGLVASSSGSGGSGVADFLLNSQHLDFGMRQNGQSVEDVSLPAWSHSPADFLRQMRAALESDYVSQNLHKWIDLVFGSSQRGEAAVKANNLFYYLTYENAVDLDAVEDPQQRRSLEMQINEFGQTPRQIFARPHPQRFQPYTPEEEEVNIAPAVSDPTADYTIPPGVAHPDFRRLESSDALPTSPVHGDSLTFPRLQLTSATPSTTSLPLNQSLSALTADGAATENIADMSFLDQGARALQLAAELDEIQTKQLRVDLGELKGSDAPLSTGGIASSGRGSFSSGSSSAGAWSSLSSDGWTRRDELSLHRDTITSVQLTRDGNLVSVSADGHIKIYSLESNKLIRSSKVCDMTLSSCSVTPDGKSVFVSCWDNSVYLYNQSYARIVTSVQAHDDAVSCMSVRGSQMVTGSWDTTVKVFSVTDSSIHPIPAHELAEHDSAITAVGIDERGTCVVSGAEDGGVMLWDVRVKDGQARNIEVRTARASNSDRLGRRQ